MAAIPMIGMFAESRCQGLSFSWLLHVHRSDPELINACLAGEQQAWNRLVEQYGRLVYSIAKRSGLDETDADDVFAAVWATAFSHLEDLRDATRLSAWLITTTHRECWRVRARSSKAAHMERTAALNSEPSDAQTELWELQHFVWLALKKLGGRCEELLTALFLEPGQGSYEIIAARLGVPVGSIGPTRARCFRKLEHVLADMGVTSDSLWHHRTQRQA